jgi:hypothetical protein
LPPEEQGPFAILLLLVAMLELLAALELFALLELLAPLELLATLELLVPLELLVLLELLATLELLVAELELLATLELLGIELELLDSVPELLLLATALELLLDSVLVLLLVSVVELLSLDASSFELEESSVGSSSSSEELEDTSDAGEELLTHLLSLQRPINPLLSVRFSIIPSISLHSLSSLERSTISPLPQDAKIARKAVNAKKAR